MFTPKTAHTVTKGNNTPSVFKPKNRSDLFIQPKLKVGQSGDKYEVEADQVADQVVHEHQNGAQSTISPTPVSVQTMIEEETIQEKPIAERIQPLTNLSDASSVQRMEEEVQTMPEEEVQMQEEEVQMQDEEDEVQMQEDEEVQTQSEDEDVQLQEDEEVQARENPGSSGLNGVNIGQSLRNTRGQGSPLSGSEQTQMESGFGADFSGVRIHTGSESVAMNRALGARAFTNGNDIHFNQNRFNPATTEGQTLLAHELTHTIQQGASGPASQEGTATTEGGSNAAQSETAVPTTGATPETQVEQTEGEAIGTPLSGEAEAQVEAQPGSEKTGVAAEPTTPRSPEEDPNFQQLEERVANTAEGQQEHEPATLVTGGAQAAAVSPSNERVGGAQAAQVATMEEQEVGEFSAEAFKAQLMQRIESMQLPANEEEAVDFENNNNIDEVRNAATQDVQNEQATAAGNISEATAQEPNTEAVPEREVTPLPPAPIGNTPNSVRAQNAMPPARGESEVSRPLQDNMAEVDQQMAENEITDDQLANSNEPEFVGALDSTHQARENTAQAPGEFRTEEQSTLQNVQTSAEGNSQETLQGMHQDRTGLLNQVAGDQVQTGTTDTAERERIAGEINTIYENTKTDVETILSDLDTRVNDMFTAGADRAKQAFEDHIEKEMDDYLDRRYGGVSGFFRRVSDVFTGLPDEVNQFFIDGREVFIERMDSVITDIANVVATELTAAKDRITQGKQEVQDYVTALPGNLQEIGREAAERIQEQFDELEQSVNDKQDELIDSLANKYNESLEAVDARIEEMKAANRGLIDMALDAVAGVIRTIINIKNMLMDLLSSALSVITTIITDPIGFLSMLIQGVGQGLNNFVSNIGQHLQSGLVGWLTGSLGPMGVQIPDNLFSLSGIFDLVAQILGITWDFIRRKAVKLLGEPVVKVVETGVEIFQVIRRDGAAGLWEYIKEEFNNLKEMVIDAIKEMVITKVIEAGIKWMLGLLSPAGAFIKAAMAIIDIVKFFIERGSQIIEMVRGFIDAVKAIASGNVSRVAGAIENALKIAIPVVIGFLASLLGISGLTQKVTKIIKKIRKKIDKAITKVIMKVKKAFKKLLRKGKAKVKGVVKGIVQWWKAKKKFKAKDGKNHKLFFKKKGKSYELMVASTPTTYEKFINDIKLTDNKLQSKKQSALTIAKKIDLLVNESITNENKDNGKKIQKELDKLSPLTAELMSGSGTSGPSSKPIFGGLIGEFGSSMRIDYLTGETTGTAASATGSGVYNTLNQRREGKGSYYIRGHLLSEKLHGTGSDWKNLTPLSRSGNRKHESDVESQIKNAIPPEGQSGNRAFRYIVIPNYGRSVNSGLLANIDASSDSPADKQTKKEIVRAERFVPTALKCTIVEIDPTDKTKEVKGSSIKSPITVDNAIDQSGPDKYQLVDVAKPDPIKVNKANQVQLAKGLSISLDLATQIVTERDKNGSFRTRESLTSRVSGLNSTEVNSWYDNGLITFAN
ncbi:DUF4157 domain-containing protein [Aquimarina sp. ERC-38]|uniref:eCIS core domain-containing protein n=1 Tax=Aquimarina sp. ERC-38 TaxID=2949996 RepID=UPI002245F85A|nr:DUF4157 domain-containing protein [Aquimarina sp. ERC-38]UZO81756.1 DUF4157 domain-containing protein [Aquimarina sp. ERC-38]